MCVIINTFSCMLLAVIRKAREAEQQCVIYTVEEKEEWGEMSVLLFVAWLLHTSEHSAQGQRVNIGWLCENCTPSTYSQRWMKKDGWGEQPFYQGIGKNENVQMQTL